MEGVSLHTFYVPRWDNHILMITGFHFYLIHLRFCFDISVSMRYWLKRISDFQATVNIFNSSFRAHFVLQFGIKIWLFKLYGTDNVSFGPNSQPWSSIRSRKVLKASAPISISKQNIHYHFLYNRCLASNISMTRSVNAGPEQLIFIVYKNSINWFTKYFSCGKIKTRLANFCGFSRCRVAV